MGRTPTSRSGASVWCATFTVVCMAALAVGLYLAFSPCMWFCCQLLIIQKMVKVCRWKAKSIRYTLLNGRSYLWVYPRDSQATPRPLSPTELKQGTPKRCVYAVANLVWKGLLQRFWNTTCTSCGSKRVLQFPTSCFRALNFVDFQVQSLGLW